jgi:hypothetical protein
MTTLIIEVRERDDRRGVYDAHCDGRYLVSSPCPFIDGCRVLLAWGYDPDASVVMRRQGSDADALRGRLGIVAGVEVNGKGNGFRRARAVAKASPMRSGEVGATSDHSAVTQAIREAA